MERYAWLAVALPFLGAIVNSWFAFRRPGMRRVVTVVGVGVVVAAFVVAVGVFREVQGAADGFRVVLWDWMPAAQQFNLELGLQFDRLSTVMLLVVTGVGSLIHIFSIGYMWQDKGYARFFAYMNLFVGFMLVLVLGSSIVVSFIGWEGVGLCSYLLIGFWFEINANSSAGAKAFYANRIGDVGVLLAMFLLWWNVGTLDFDSIARLAPAALAPGGATVTLIALLIFLGCTGKSAQIPLFTWLPDAMAGPTPVSALIHAATMVTAGVFLVVRTGVIFTMAPVAMAVVTVVGALTAFFAATIALRQDDIKKVLAYSTVSQLGYMFMAVGSGAWTAGMFHLISHAFFKGLLFLGAGSVIHVMHEALHHGNSDADAQNMRNMGGLWRRMPWTFAMMAVATLAIAGVPPLAGFFSKDEILAATFARGDLSWIYIFSWALGLLAALCTAYYMARLMAMTFLGKFRSGEATESALHEAPAVMTTPIVALGLLTIVGGFINLPAFAGGNQALEHWLDPVLEHANAIMPTLVMPHGGTEALLVGGAVVIAIVGLLWGWLLVRRRPVLLPAEAPPPTGVARLLAGKYFVDEFYQKTVVGPLMWLSRSVLWKGMDQFLIDRLGVGGVARVSQGLGWLGSRLQNGQVAVYVTIFAIGAVIVVRLLVGGG